MDLESAQNNALAKLPLLNTAIKVRFGGNKAQEDKRLLLKQDVMKTLMLLVRVTWTLSLPRALENYLGSISFDDLYNNFKVIEQEVKRSVISSSNSSSQNVAFVSTPSSTDDVNISNVHTKGRMHQLYNIGTFTRSDRIRNPRSQENRSRNQDSSRRTVNVEESSSKAIFEDLKSQYDNLRIELNKSKFDLANYKRGLASVDVTNYVSTRKLERLKKEKESNQIKIDNFENASKSLDKLIGSLFAPPTIDLSNSGLEEFKQPEFEGYGVKFDQERKEADDIDWSKIIEHAQKMTSQATNFNAKGIKFSIETKPAKRQRTEEVSESVQEQTDKEPKTDELSQEQLNQMVIIVQDERMNVEALQTKYPIIGWEVYSEDIQERYNSSGLAEDKEIELWVEIKLLFEPYAEKNLELQKDMHDPLNWWLYDTCVVRHVSTKKGQDIFMLVEKDYPLTIRLATLMLVNKLRVDQHSEMCDGYGYDWSDQAEECPTNFSLMAYSSTSSTSSINSE
ncbi:hypothetical protein Tco_1077300, partial [Tanacetum coccineum]